MEKTQCCTDPKEKAINISYVIINLFPSYQFVVYITSMNVLYVIYKYIIYAVYERLIYNSLYKDTSDNLLSLYQAGFRTGDSCIN